MPQAPMVWGTLTFLLVRTLQNPTLRLWLLPELKNINMTCRLPYTYSRNKQTLVKTNFGWYSYFLGHAKEDCSIIAPRDTHCPHCRHLSLRLIKRKLLLRSIHSIDETLHQFLFIYTVIIANRQVPTRTRRLTFFGSNFNLPNFHIWPLRYYNYC